MESDVAIAHTIQEINIANLTQLLLVAAFSLSIALITRVSQDWYPFTPTFTSERKWVGWQDIFRWLFSGIFLFLAPFVFLAWALVIVRGASIHVPLTFPSATEMLKILSVIFLPVMLLGFYDIWQAIVRTWPAVFYSPMARAKIEERHSAAFKGGQLATLILGFGWLIGPIIFFEMVKLL